jgi:hypothetical protein
MQLKTTLVALLLFAAPVPAFAIDFTTVLTDLDGATPLKDVYPLNEPDQAKHPDLTLGLAAAHALTFDGRDDQSSGDEKRHRGDLAIRIVKAKDIKLEAEDVATIKKMMPKIWSPLVIARSWPLLDPAAK